MCFFYEDRFLYPFLIENLDFETLLALFLAPCWDLFRNKILPNRSQDPSEATQENTAKNVSVGVQRRNSILGFVSRRGLPKASQNP